MGWRTTRAGRVGTGDCGGIEEVAALVRTGRGNGGVREEKRETEIGRVSGGKGEKRIIRERRGMVTAVVDCTRCVGAERERGRVRRRRSSSGASLSPRV